MQDIPSTSSDICDGRNSIQWDGAIDRSINDFDKQLVLLI
jgi:hypothetical protein